MPAPWSSTPVDAVRPKVRGSPGCSPASRAMLISVAQANKTARIVWAVLITKQDYRARVVSGNTAATRGRRRTEQAIEGGYGATVGMTGLEEPGFGLVPRARLSDLAPIRELPYRPAANAALTGRTDGSIRSRAH